MNDTIGQAPKGFQLNEGVGETYRVIENYTAASAYGGIKNHYSVLRLQHTKFMQKGNAQLNFSSHATGNDNTCEFWMCNPGPYSLNNIQTIAYFRNDTGIVAGISLDAGKIEVYQRTGFTLVKSYVMNSWMHISFEFDISSEQFTVTVNGTVLGTYTLGITTEITNIQFWTEQWYNNPSDGTYNVYVDAIGYNWSSNYHTGDNLNLIDGMITGELNGEYTFKNDQIGLHPAQFTINEGIGENYSVIASYAATKGHRGYDTHNTALRLQHTTFMQKGYAQHDFSSPATGNDKTCEFWMCNPGPYSLNNIQIIAYFKNDTAIVAGISLDAGKIEVYQRTGFTYMTSYPMNSWMHFRFEFDISSEQFTVTVNETIVGTYTLGITTEITNIQFWTEQWYNNPIDGTYNVYVDAIGYNWSGNYNTGDNLRLVPWTQPTVDTPVDQNWMLGTTGHTISWMVTGGAGGTRSYTVYRNESSFTNGTWTSGAAIPVSIEETGIGFWNFTILATDGFGGSCSDMVLVNVSEAIYRSGIPFTLPNGINMIFIMDDIFSVKLFELTINVLGSITLNVTIVSTNPETISLPNAQRFFIIDVIAGSFTSSANVKFYFDDSKLTSSQEQLLRLYRFDPSENGWIKTTSTNYPGENFVVAQLSHFSVYGIGYEEPTLPFDWVQITIIASIAGVIVVVIALILKLRGKGGKGLSPSNEGELDFDFD